MKWGVVLGTLSLFCVGVANAGPTEGSFRASVFVKSKTESPMPPWIPVSAEQIAELQPLSFAGGQRASVILTNSSKINSVNFTLVIIDVVTKSPIAQASGQNVCGVVWYPAQTKRYQIAVRYESVNNTPDGNFLPCELSVK